MSSVHTQMSATANTPSRYERAQRAAEQIRSRANARPSVAIVLGSGLGAFADELTESTSLAYKEIAGFAQATVEGHAGRLVIGRAGEVPIAAMQGRFHFYEGYSLEDVTFPIRVLKLLGVRTLILTNAVGMSTVPEAIVARHMDMQVIGISCITNLAAGVSNRPVDHSQVIATGERVRAQFTELLRRVIARLG